MFKARNAKTVKLLLNYGADATISCNHKVTAIEYLLKFSSGCSKAILDECLSKQSDDTLIMNFLVLETEDDKRKSRNDTSHCWSIIEEDKEMALYHAVMKTNRSSLLLHPLMQIFLNLKFKTVERMFKLAALFDLVLTMTLSWIGITYVDITNCNTFENGSAFSTYTEKIIYENHTSNEANVICHLNTIRRKEDRLPNYSELEVTCDALNLGKDYWAHYWLIIWAQMFLGVCLFRELYQLLTQGFKAYFKGLNNWIEILILVLSITFFAVSNDYMNIALHCAAWMVFLVWVDLILFLGKFDTLGSYVFMSVDVTKTMLFCLSMYIPSFFAFSFGFYILLRPSDRFQSYTATLIKVMSMMVGDISYDDDFSYHAVEENGGRNYSTQLMFTFFLISMMMIIMNLLLAVTVSKTEYLVDKSIMMLSEQRIDDIMMSTSGPKLFIYIKQNLQKKMEKWLGKIPLLNWFLPITDKCILDRCRNGEGGRRNFTVKYTKMFHCLF